MTRPTGFLILADEAATWRVAGLTQLDRIVLALNEWIDKNWPNEIVPAVIFWHRDVAGGTRWLPRHPRITHIRVTESLKSAAPGALMLHTRVFIHREGMAELFPVISDVQLEAIPEESDESWNGLNVRFQSAIAARLNGSVASAWRYLRSQADVAGCERELLRQSGKSQDGIVSRFFNRPCSRFVSGFLLRYDLAPTTWTMALFVLPMAAFFCLARGDYGGIIAGALLFQVYSMLDGCDGEIARATYQESSRGGRIDDFLDMLGSVLFVLGLGLGLFRSRSSFYLLEGILCAAVIVINEWSLRRVQLADQPESEKLTEALYPRHRRLLAGRPSQIFNDNVWWWIIQFTKRDAAILAFLLLALADQSPWILHLWFTVSATTLILSARSSAGLTTTI